MSQLHSGDAPLFMNEPDDPTQHLDVFVVPNAKVTITGPTGQTIHATTSGSGSYSSGALIPGAYTVRVEAKGFKTAQLSMDVQVDNAANGSMKLEIGQESTVVEVQASEIQVNTEQATVQGVLTSSQIENLPVNGRNFLDFVTLTPGVSIVQGPDGNEISINGQKGINNNVSIDGADNNNPFFGEQRGGQRPPFTVNLDAVQEFQVVADGAPAEFGRSSSGFINVVTKSGTNDIHGTAHEFQRWTGLTARQSDGTRISGFSQEQLGGTIGGGIAS